MRRSQEALALARTLGHAFSSADALCFAGCLFNTLARDVSALRESAGGVDAHLESDGLLLFWGHGTAYEGIVLAQQATVAKGLHEFASAWNAGSPRGTGGAEKTLLLGSLAEAEAKAGQRSEALRTFDKALALARETGEHFYEAELQRLRANY